MQSCIYEGVVRHRRTLPTPHAFTYRLFMMYVDLGELPTLFDGRWLWSVGRATPATFERSDYLGDPGVPLDEAVRCLVTERIGRRPDGPIRLLTHFRYFGHCFNPVSFYYCYAADGRGLEAIVVDITNTPWRERHAYVLDCASRPTTGRHRFRLDKAFHISPFMDMDIGYDWRFSAPASRLAVYMASSDHSVAFFDATLVLRRREITSTSLSGVLARFPFMTLRVISAIYWQAARLRLKGIPFFTHPRFRPAAQETRPQ